MCGIGDKLKELRKNSGLTQEKVADSLGVSYQAVSKWETGVASPDLALIIPLANLFHVTTDELLGNKNRRTELEHIWRKTLSLGECDEFETLKIAEMALQEFPNDETFLFRQAYGEYVCAGKVTDESKKRRYLEISLWHFKKLMEKFPDDPHSSNMEMLVIVLSALGRYEEAISYTQNHPKKDRMLKYCLTGEALDKHLQKLIEEKLRDLLDEMREYRTMESIQTAENIINTVLTDCNYLYYYDSLMMIYIRRAELLAGEKCYDEAMECLQKSLHYAKNHKELSGKGTLYFTASVFDKLTYDTSMLSEFDPVEGFYMNLTGCNSQCFDGLRDREDFVALMKEVEMYV